MLEWNPSPRDLKEETASKESHRRSFFYKGVLETTPRPPDEVIEIVNGLKSGKGKRADRISKMERLMESYPAQWTEAKKWSTTDRKKSTKGEYKTGLRTGRRLHLSTNIKKMHDEDRKSVV